MTHHARCKFCQLPITVESDPDCPLEWSTMLATLLACNQCADYRARMTKLLDSIRHTCLTYIQAHNSKDKKVMTDQFMADTRATLSRLTRTLADAACRHRGIATVWEPDFTQQLLDMPDKSSKVVAAYMKLLPSPKLPMIRLFLSLFLLPLLCLSCGREPKAKPLLASTNITWVGHPVVCDGDRYTPSQGWLPGYDLGFRDDGVIVWRKSK